MFFQKVSFEEEEGLNDRVNEALSRGEPIKMDTFERYNTEGQMQYTTTAPVTQLIAEGKLQ